MGGLLGGGGCCGVGGSVGGLYGVRGGCCGVGGGVVVGGCMGWGGWVGYWGLCGVCVGWGGHGWAAHRKPWGSDAGLVRGCGADPQVGLRVVPPPHMGGLLTLPPPQESYVWKMYQERCWDFFPAGDCFRKQYEDQLG